ncbi:hypothetical protein KZC51_13125 [Microbacterium sp. SSW1-49]|uniref:Uncharacterized protein n=1 Tax=Microbacterium croceum TaxID=2851645 RepID=A0ABT0FG80_9MICO|nr:hypothetical protein [Microbacterium croceum]MCK2037073.1 hypothetical protein [Microbacterium croceum]
MDDRVELPGLAVGTYRFERSMARSMVEHSSSYVALDPPSMVPSMTIVTKRGDVWSQPSARHAAQHPLHIGVEVDAGRIYVIARKTLPLTDPVACRWVGDVGRLVAVLSQPDAPLSAEIAEHWRSRDVERVALFAASRSGRGFAIVLLVVVLGLVAAALSAALT